MTLQDFIENLFLSLPVKLCTTSEKLCTALEIGHTGEMYMTEGQYSLALGKFESCLASLMPLLALEPRGPRRDLLHKQVRKVHLPLVFFSFVSTR